MAEARAIYELQAKGREPRTFDDPARAGAAFFAAKRDESPKVLMHQGDATVHIAITTRDAREPSGYGHLLLESPAEFKQGYDKARQAQPDRAVALQDIADVPLTKTAEPFHAMKGIPVSEQQQPQHAAQQQITEAPATRRLQVRAVDVNKLNFTKTQDEHGVRVSYTALDKAGKVIARHGSISHRDLPYHLGETVARAVLDYKGPEGQFVGKHLDAPISDPEPRMNVNWKVQMENAHAAEAREAAAKQARGANAEVVNSIEPTPDRVQQQSPQVQQQAASPVQTAPAPEPTKDDRQRALLSSLHERFDVRGNDFHFKGEPGRVAFTDHGKQLSSKSDVPAVVRAMAEMAQAKGWEGIRIKGTPEFTRSVWLEASLRGIDVQGHTPTAEDRKRLAQAQQKQAEQQQKDPGQQKPLERGGNTMEQTAPVQGQERPQQTPQPQPAAQAAQQAQAATPDTKREQAMNAMRSYLGTLKLDAPTVAATMKEWGAHIDKAIAQGKAVPTVRVYDPAVARTTAPTQAVVPQQSVQERAAPAR